VGLFHHTSQLQYWPNGLCTAAKLIMNFTVVATQPHQAYTWKHEWSN
jgi:hypothetical protein